MTSAIYLIIAIISTVILFKFFKLFAQRHKATQKYIPWVSGLELGLWTFFVFWAVNIFFYDKLYYPYIIIILVITFTMLLVWLYVKDIVAGFLFQIRHNPAKGQYLRCGHLHGTIKKVGLSDLTVEEANGQTNRVPYSSIVAEKISIKTLHTNSPGETILKLKLAKNIDFGDAERLIRQALALSFWCVASKPISVYPDAVDDKVVQVSFFMLDPIYFPLAKNKLSKMTEGDS